MTTKKVVCTEIKVPPGYVELKMTTNAAATELLKKLRKRKGYQGRGWKKVHCDKGGRAVLARYPDED